MPPQPQSKSNHHSSNAPRSPPSIGLAAAAAARARRPRPQVPPPHPQPALPASLAAAAACRAAACAAACCAAASLQPRPPARAASISSTRWHYASAEAQAGANGAETEAVSQPSSLPANHKSDAPGVAPLTARVTRRPTTVLRLFGRALAAHRSDFLGGPCFCSGAEISAVPSSLIVMVCWICARKEGRERCGSVHSQTELRHRSLPLIEPQISLPIPQRQIYGHGWCMERYNIILVRRAIIDARKPGSRHPTAPPTAAVCVCCEYRASRTFGSFADPSSPAYHCPPPRLLQACEQQLQPIRNTLR